MEARTADEEHLHPARFDEVVFETTDLSNNRSRSVKCSSTKGFFYVREGVLDVAMVRVIRQQLLQYIMKFNNELLSPNPLVPGKE